MKNYIVDTQSLKPVYEFMDREGRPEDCEFWVSVCSIAEMVVGKGYEQFKARIKNRIEDYGYERILNQPTKLLKSYISNDKTVLVFPKNTLLEHLQDNTRWQDLHNEVCGSEFSDGVNKFVNFLNSGESEKEKKQEYIQYLEEEDSSIIDDFLCINECQKAGIKYEPKNSHIKSCLSSFLKAYKAFWLRTLKDSRPVKNSDLIDLYLTYPLWQSDWFLISDNTSDYSNYNLPGKVITFEEFKNKHFQPS